MGKWQKHKITHTQEGQEVSPFPVDDHKVAMNRQGSMTDTKHKLLKKDPQKKHRFVTVSKILFTGGLKLVSWNRPHPYFWCESRQIDVWFDWKIPKLSMYHLLVNTNRDIKMRQNKQCIQLNNGVKEVQQWNPIGLDHRHNVRTQIQQVKIKKLYLTPLIWNKQHKLCRAFIAT